MSIDDDARMVSLMFGDLRTADELIQMLSTALKVAGLQAGALTAEVTQERATALVSDLRHLVRLGARIELAIKSGQPE